MVEKAKLSITINKDLLNAAENEVRLRAYKNISQFTEHAIRTHLKEPWRIDAMLHMKYSRLAELYRMRVKERLELQEEERQVILE